MHNRARTLLSLAAASAASAVASAVVIHPTFDTTVTSSPNSAQIESAFNYAAAQFQNNFSDNVTINITVKSTPGTGTLGQSNTNLIGPFTYSQIIAALTSHATTANDTTALASLPGTDPTGQNAYIVSRAQAKALGIGGVSANDSNIDGTFTFGTGYTYTYDPNNRAVPGSIDFIGVAMHEISEIMGRIFLLGENLTGQPNYVPLDLFRFVSANTRNMVPAASGVYFSIDNGVTNLKGYNAVQGADYQDWASGTNDSFNAFSSSGVKNDLTAVDFIVMDVIGYTLNPSCPLFTQQPSPAKPCRTGTATLSVSVTGSPTYQWFKGTTALSNAAGHIAGATTSTLTISNAQAGDTGSYTCTATSTCSTTSNPATVSVCVADFNCSGAVTVQDIFDFLSAWFAHASSADVNGSGTVTVQDIFDFLNAWFAGC